MSKQRICFIENWLQRDDSQLTDRSVKLEYALMYCLVS